jgi:hypothetical protein
LQIEAEEGAAEIEAEDGLAAAPAGREQGKGKVG